MFSSIRQKTTTTLLGKKYNCFFLVFYARQIGNIVIFCTSLFLLWKSGDINMPQKTVFNRHHLHSGCGNVADIDACLMPFFIGHFDIKSSNCSTVCLFFTYFPWCMCVDDLCCVFQTGISYKPKSFWWCCCCCCLYSM